MKFSIVVALLGFTSALRLNTLDDSDPEGRNVDQTTWKDMHVSGYNGADEDEIMDNIFGKFSTEGRTPSGHKTGQKLLMKDQAKLAGGTLLEALHKVEPADVPAYLDANFENTWNHFDQNHEGWIRYEETHTFQRHLMGKLNQFAGTPGSLGDLASGGKTYPLPYPAGSEAVPVGQV
uniref:EF-hand domain-containing protein n=1 Tax=Strombidium inclinatum TaxID=197538 RepID=A0A7S3MY01_9SPIT|mmetsp:Transcript_26520/g.40503  ORF Transcript_26520/g.40503 Transcript_26520/m.40503 type:complete len:177 (+) Transcript_26520:35-565(+)|eukprot:CAMPEP_0170491360 /NCGR_PEP_ID=MMETSP0208-20121228/10877_1 /TAXON_ID=197538 /ORGANISM="Strombidium inclinatum, Strain S3" /LENGTH=176 /DNA_ID=CAMNT_0010766923 /DNA_START=6 /DNA_END=536 /DNA_ORIENTATION=+